MTNRQTTGVTYGAPKLSASRASLLFGTALGVSIAIFAAMPNQAWAADECGADVGGVAVCTNVGNPYPTGIDYTGDAGEDITVVLLGGALAPTIVTGAAEDGVTATASAGFDATVYVYAAASIDATLNGIEVDSGTGNSYVVNNGTVTGDLGGINAYSVFGNTYITNTGAVTSTGLAAGNSIGIYGGGADYTYISNSGAVSATEASVSGAAGIYANTYYGDAVIDNSGVVTSTNTVGASFGILASTQAFGTIGDVDINTDAAVTSTGGSSAFGIVSNAYGDSTITSTADITATATAGQARGVVANTYYNTVIDITGNVSATGTTTAYAIEVNGNNTLASSTVDVTVDGDLTANGAGFTEGVDIYTGGAITVDVGNISAISTAGGAYGVFAVSYYGDVTVVTDDIIANGVAGGAGIDAFAGGFAGQADISITAGDISTTGSNAEGVEADAIYGAVTISVGDVDTTGAGAEGVDSYAYLDSSVTAGDITTVGIGADGVHNYSFLGDTNTNVGDVTTTGDDSYGVYAYAFIGNSVVTAEDVSTTGAGSVGIFAYGFGYASVAAVSVTTTGDNADGVNALAETGSAIVETQLVVTSGNTSTGIEAISADSYVLVNSGTVNTTGDDSDGIYAVSLGTDPTDYVTVNSGVITTDGLNSDGIVAYAYTGPVTIDSGTIDTLGDNSYGIYAKGYFGDVAVTSDAITTAGVNSMGIYAYSYFGGTTVVSGSVDTAGDNSTGIYAYGYTGVDVTSTAVTTSGASANGIEARSLFGTVAVDSGTVDTTGDNSVGILAFGYGGTSVISDAVTTDGLNSEGIVALDYAGPTSVDSGSVVTLGDYSTGIRAGSYIGDVSVTSDTVETSGDSSIGIYAYSVNGGAFGVGDVDVSFGTVVTNGDAALAFTVPYAGGNFYYYGATSDGIVATSSTGEVSVTGGDVTTNGLGASGIVASGFGDVYINVDDVVTNGEALIYYDGPVVTTFYSSAGINGDVTGGDLTIFADTVETHGYGAAGIVATGYAYYDSVATTYSGDVRVGVNSVETFGDYADGVFASNAGGDVIVNTGTVITRGDGSDGIIATANSYYDSSTISTIVGNAYAEADFITTYGDDAYGMIVVSQGGDATANAYSVHTYGDGSTGIYAAAFNYYDSSTGAPQNLQGDVEIDADFVITEGDNATGILAYAEGGSIDIDAFSVRTFGDFSTGVSANAAYYGIDPVLLTYYSGDVRIETGYVATYGDFSDGINAFAGGGDVNIYSGDVFVYGLGSNAIVASTGGLDVNNTDDVFIQLNGDTYSAYGIGVSVDSAGASDIDNSGDLYGYLWGIQSDSVDGTYIYNDGSITGGLGAAIDIDGGAAEILNYGYIGGYIDLTDNNDYVYNDGVWEAYGVSDFGLGVDQVVNTGTVGFSRYQGVASTTTFAGLEYFDNYGLVTGVDGQAGDSLNISGNFFGGAGSQLALDVQLGGPGSIADTLVIGSASGVTEILPSDTLSATPGALNFGGILVVDSANAAETGTEFVMDNVDKGFVEYSLIFDAAGDNWLIVGLPDDEVFEMLGAMSSSQDFWRRSADALTARWQEVRDASPTGSAQAGPGGMGRSDGWELWMQAHGGEESFDNAASFTLGGFTFAQDLTATSDWRGFQFGFDNLQGNTIWGLTMGFTQQETKFDVDGNSFDTEGWNIGAYAGWSSGGFFLNGLVKGDFFEQDANFHTLPSIFTFDGVTWGAQGEIGYRWEGESVFFEPVASLQWSTTNLDSTTTAGATIDFDDAESLRGKAGARLGGTWGTGDVVWTPYIGAYWVDEFQGDNNLAFTTGVTTIEFSDQGRGSYGQADLGVTFQTFYGLEGFVKGEWNFGGDADGGAARLGARWRW